MLDALTVLRDIFADRAIVVFSDVNEQLDEGFAAFNENGLYALIGNSFFASAFQAQDIRVEFLGQVEIFASDTNMVNSDYFKHRNLLL